MVQRSTKADEARLRADLSYWLTLEQLDQLLDRYRSEFGKIVGADGNLQLWREAFHVSRLARAYGVTAVRAGNNPPDFVVRSGGNELPLEITEVRSPHDLTGREFVEWAELEADGLSIAAKPYDPSNDWESAPQRIRQAITEKGAKSYSSDTVLAVAVSSFWFGDRDPRTAQEIELACASGEGRFKEVWVSFGSKHLRWPAVERPCAD